MGVGRGPDVVHPGVVQLFPGGQQDHPVADDGLLGDPRPGDPAGAQGLDLRPWGQGPGLLQKLPLCFYRVNITHEFRQQQLSVPALGQHHPFPFRQIGGVIGDDLVGLHLGPPLLPLKDPVYPEGHPPFQNRLLRHRQPVVHIQGQAQLFQQLSGGFSLDLRLDLLAVIDNRHPWVPVHRNGLRFPGVGGHRAQLHPRGPQDRLRLPKESGAAIHPPSVQDRPGGGEDTLAQYSRQKQHRPP